LGETLGRDRIATSRTLLRCNNVGAHWVRVHLLGISWQNDLDRVTDGVKAAPLVGQSNLFAGDEDVRVRTVRIESYATGSH
jgi:hypothetical protein